MFSNVFFHCTDRKSAIILIFGLFASHVFRPWIMSTKFEHDQPISSRLLAFHCWYITSRCNLDRFSLWPWTFEVSRLSCDRTLYQILATEVNNPRPSYSDLNIKNLGFVRHLKLEGGMVRVWVVGKTVWSPCYTRATSERFRDGVMTKR